MRIHAYQGFCSICNKTFRILKDHIRNVHCEKQFFCGFEGCDKGFSKKHGLERHLMTHSDDFKPFQCPKCLRKFVERLQLERHFVVHQKVKFVTAHRCHQCLKYLNRRADLIRHVNTVHKEKKFECNECPDRRFGTKFEVLRHFKVVHLGLKLKRPKFERVPIDEIMSSTLIEEISGMSEDGDDFEVEALDASDTDVCESIRQEIVEQAANRARRITVESAEEMVQVIGPNTETEERLPTPEINIWECQRCNRPFDSQQRLTLHNKRNHNWRCKKCSGINTFHRREDYQLHWIEQHAGDQALYQDKIECAICLDLFADKAAVVNHQKHEHVDYLLSP